MRLVDESSGVCVRVRACMCACVCVCVCVGGGGGRGCPGKVGKKDMFSAVIICIVIFFLNPVCLFIIINLNAFDVALMCILHVVLN